MDLKGPLPPLTFRAANVQDRHHAFLISTSMERVTWQGMTDRCKNINENFMKTIYLAFTSSIIDYSDEIINNDWLIYILETSQLVLRS